MPRVKRSVHARKKRRKVLEQAKGYWGIKKSSYKYAKEQVEHKLVRKLADRRWRDKLGLFVAEGEDLVDAAWAAGIEPVELLVAGETVAPELLAEVSALGHPARAVGIYRREDLPSGVRPRTLAL